MKSPRVGLVGLGGYGRVHLQHLRDFHARGELVLAAAVAFPPEQEAAEAAALRALGCEVVSGFADLLMALSRLKLDLVIVPTPIHLHARMTIALLRAGVHVLVEKPLAATLDEVAAVLAAERETGRVVAVGFQYLHAPEVLALKRQLLGGAIGSLRRIVVHAAWPRSHAYYTRNAWAGRIRLGEDWVLDSPVNNAMSHFLMVMFLLAGRTERTLAAPVSLAAELHRAQAIESFDTAVVQFETADGCRLDFYGTHSSRHISRPTLQIEGTEGRAEWIQDGHASLVTRVGGSWEAKAAPESDTRERMLRDVLARLAGMDALICTPAMAAVHVAAVAALHQVSIATVAPAHLAGHAEDGQQFTHIAGLDDVLSRAAREGIGLRQAGAIWAGEPARVPLAHLA